MLLSRTFRNIPLVALLPLCTLALQANAQFSKNPFPCAACAVYDNNGNDLRGFIANNKKDFMARGERINDYSANTWGYIHVKNVKIPSVDKKGNLNYSEFINTTLAMSKMADGAKATWWARQSNAPKGALVYEKVEEKADLGMPNVKYKEVLHDLELKKITLVEYANDNYNPEDYDALINNYILAPAGLVKNAADYKELIAFYNAFMGKFSSLNDPFLETKSFVTFVTVNKTHYVAVFNMVNEKLAGKLMTADIAYEKDKDVFIADVFKKTTGKTVFIYGNDVIGMERNFLKYGSTHNIKLIRKTTSGTKSFNDEK